MLPTQSLTHGPPAVTTPGRLQNPRLIPTLQSRSQVTRSIGGSYAQESPRSPNGNDFSMPTFFSVCAYLLCEKAK
jgi:hypothetical protein